MSVEDDLNDGYSMEDYTYVWDTCYAIMYEAHKGVVRWFTEEPYSHHPYRVAQTVERAGVRDPDVVAAALLHDVIEDTPYSAEVLLSLHVRPRTVELVQTLSNRDGESYEDFIARIQEDPDAVTIKKADISDNLATLPTGHKLAARYIGALHTLHGVPYLVDAGPDKYADLEF